MCALTPPTAARLLLFATRRPQRSHSHPLAQVGEAGPAKERLRVQVGAAGCDSVAPLARSSFSSPLPGADTRTPAERQEKRRKYTPVLPAHLSSGVQRSDAARQVAVARPSEVDSLLPAPGASWVVAKKAEKLAVRESQQTDAPRRSLRAREEKTYVDDGGSDEFDASSEEESEEEEEGEDKEKEPARGTTPPPPSMPPPVAAAEPPPNLTPMDSTPMEP